MWNLRPGNVFNNLSKESQPIIMLIPEHAILEFSDIALRWGLSYCNKNNFIALHGDEQNRIGKYLERQECSS